MNGLVSAIVAVYNEERYLGECVASLQAQTYRPLEILLADDGSTDGSAAIARQAGIRVLTGPHHGKARTLNAAAARAAGDIVLFLDGDLVFEPDYVARLVAPIQAGQAVGSCHGTERVANPGNRWSRCWQLEAGLPPTHRVRADPDAVARGSTIFRAVRRDRFLAVGGFDDTGHTDDATLYPKLGQAAVFVPQAACAHHNVETLAEVFGQGVWSGKSEYLRHGARALWHYALPRSLVRAVAAGLRHRSAFLIPYRLAADAGTFWGVLRSATGADRSHGR